MLLALFALALLYTANASVCGALSPPVAQCVPDIPRDLVFILDGSNSLDRTAFYTKLLDFVEKIYCIFNKANPNRAGLILFHRDIKVAIPLARYTPTQWFAQVEIVRADATSCCSCCTPTAEAFQLAANQFTANGFNANKIAFVISDGTPANNVPDVAPTTWMWQYGNPAWAFSGYNPARYAAEIVPSYATTLKHAAGGVRLIFLAVPSRVGGAPRTDYFSGTMPNPYWEYRNNVNYTWNMPTPRVPVVSLPISENLFRSPTMDVDSLVNLVHDALCRVTTAPTKSPTKRTNAPSLPTNAPSRPPVMGYCTGAPCNLDPVNQCRSMWGYCGTGWAYCNWNSIWSPPCYVAPPPTAPTIPPPDIWCSTYYADPHLVRSLVRGNSETKYDTQQCTNTGYKNFAITSSFTITTYQDFSYRPPPTPSVITQITFTDKTTSPNPAFTIITDQNWGYTGTRFRTVGIFTIEYIEQVWYWGVLYMVKAKITAPGLSATLFRRLDIANILGITACVTSPSIGLAKDGCAVADFIKFESVLPFQIPTRRLAHSRLLQQNMVYVNNTLCENVTEEFKESCNVDIFMTNETGFANLSLDFEQIMGSHVQDQLTFAPTTSPLPVK